MEPKLVRKELSDKELKRQRNILIVGLVLVISLFIGSSYSLLASHDEMEDAINFQTGELNMQLTIDGESINLNGEIPKNYTEGFKNKEVTLNLKNTGSMEIGEYQVKLKSDEGSNLEEKYIRYSISEDGESYYEPKLLDSNEGIIYTGYSLKKEGIKTLKLKVWIDEQAGSAALSKTYSGHIELELFQKSNDKTIVDEVKSRLISNYSSSKENFNGGIVGVNLEGDLYNEEKVEEIREYRYSGPSVNNYVTFNNEMWRIIGVFKEDNEEFVKIVRDDILNSSYLPEKFNINEIEYSVHSHLGDYPSAAYWHGSKSINDWTTAGLQNYLNNQTDSTGINKGYLNFITKEYEDMIRVTTYYLGNVKSIGNDDTATAMSSYIDERDSMNIHEGNKATWRGKIGLMYPSDYGYSVNKKYWNNLLLFSYNQAFSNSWMSKMISAKSSHTWLISPYKDNLFTANILLSDGIVTGTTTYNTGSNDGQDVTVRPCLYLKSNVKITGGTGAEQSPYKLFLN